MARDFQILKVWETKIFVPVLVLGIIEFSILVAIIRQMYITADVLRKAQYVKNRGKQIGFRYFVFANIMAYALFLFADASILMFVPRGFMLHTESDELTYFRYFFYVGLFAPVPRLLSYATTAMAAYVNLPADSVGFMGWFKGCGKSEHGKEPISFKVYSKKKDFNLSSMSSSIVLDLLVELFNFSDIAYLRKSNAVKSQNALNFAEGQGFCLELELFNEEDETYGNVFTSENQIIVAFKGTTSVENMKTDMKVSTVDISEALPSKRKTRLFYRALLRCFPRDIGEPRRCSQSQNQRCICGNIRIATVRKLLLGKGIQ